MRSFLRGPAAHAAVLLLFASVVAGCCCPRASRCGCPCPSRPCRTAPPAPPSQVQTLPGGGLVVAGTASPKSLFERLGGMDGLAAVTDDFLPRLFADKVVMGNPAVAERMAKVDPALVRKRLIEQLCEMTGGPCKYEGKAMRPAHKGLGITETEWSAAAADFAAALDAKKVAAREKGEILALIQRLEPDVVGQ